MAISQGLLEFDRRNPRLDELPNEVAIEIVMGCNLRCPMCPVSGLPHSMNGRRPTLMTAAVFNRVIDQISDRPRSILLNVFGESLLHPQLVEFIRIAKTPRHHVAIITNGTRLTPAYAGQIIDAGLDALTVSIDGLRHDTYAGMRIGAEMGAVVDNLRALIAENARRGHRMRIEINYIRSSTTAQEMAAFHNEFAPLVAVINYTPVTDFGSHWDLPREMPEPGADPRLVAMAPRLPARTPCQHLWRALWVSAEGRVMLCTNDFKQESALPYVTGRSLRDIWRDDVGRIRRDQVEGRYDSEPCRSCRLNDVSEVRPKPERQRILAAKRREALMTTIIPRSLLTARLKARRAVRAASSGWIDTPSSGSTVAGVVIVQGWTFGGTGRTIERVCVRVDGVAHGIARYDQFRPDVGEVHPGEGHSFSGFSYTLDTSALANGPHSLDVTVMDSWHDHVDLEPRPILVSN
jgi:radical SAM protein with 4Fe4S-binding SPASM domain